MFSAGEYVHILSGTLRLFCVRMCVSARYSAIRQLLPELHTSASLPMSPCRETHEAVCACALDILYLENPPKELKYSGYLLLWNTVILLLCELHLSQVFEREFWSVARSKDSNKQWKLQPCFKSTCLRRARAFQLEIDQGQLYVTNPRDNCYHHASGIRLVFLCELLRPVFENTYFLAIWHISTYNR